MELESVLFEKLPQFLTELAAEDLAECLNGQEESGRRVDPSGTIGGKTAGGDDVVNVWMNTSAPTIPCSRKATRSGFSILSIRFMVLLFKSSAGPSVEMAQSLSSMEAEHG